jgi:hypothetical protein
MAIGASLAPRSICAFRCLSDRLFRLRCGRASVSRRLETIEFTDGERQLALAMFYPAALSDSSAKPAGLPFFTNLHLYRDAGLAEGRHPLVMLSHGRGSNPLQYAWFAETLASQGYIVAGLYHYRANTYDQSIAYLSNKIWQRPRDFSSAAEGPGMGQRYRRAEDLRRRSFARRLHLALDRRRQGQCRQIPRLPAGLEEQSADSGLSAE